VWFPMARSVRTGRERFFCICCHPANTTWVCLKMMGTAKSMVIPLLNHNVHIQIVSGWWFGTFFIFHIIWDNPSHWRTHIFQDGYCTTNQDLFGNFQGDTLFISTKSAQKRHLEMGPLLPPRTSQDLDGKFKHALGRTPRTPRTPRGS